jgi:hypothetical protein
MASEKPGEGGIEKVGVDRAASVVHEAGDDIDVEVAQFAKTFVCPRPVAGFNRFGTNIF